MASFFSPYTHEFIRVATCVPHVAVADPRQNADNVLELLASGDKARTALMVFPELGISAYAIDDLLFQDAVLDAVDRQLARLISASRDLFPLFAVGGGSITAACLSIADGCWASSPRSICRITGNFTTAGN